MASYVVNWERSDGQPGWHPVGDVQEATSYVEHLRNAEGVDVTRIYRLEEVAFEFRPYYKVELAVPSTSFAARIAPDSAPEPVAEPVSQPVADTATEPVAQPEAAAEATGLDAEEHVGVTAPSWATVIDSEPDAEASNGSGRRGLFGR